MATLRNKRKLAAVTRKTQEENPRNGQSRNTSVPRINEEYITQVSEKIEGRVLKKLSQEFSRTESRILGTLTKLDEFLSNQQIHTHFETVPGTFRNTNVENQGTNEDDSQSDPHPEAGIFRGQTTQNFRPKGCRDRKQKLLQWNVFFLFDVCQLRSPQHRQLFKFVNVIFFIKLQQICRKCNPNGKISENVQILGLFLEHRLVFRKKNLNHLKIAKGSKFAVECISNGIMS